ncbi:glutathione S-transferase A-like [Haliotis asinina]|uniref:glutathione S-transferase A-like n=1 Tax=Haliotis asinina TaxID=109174 RepID=UPI00353231B6
MYETDNIALTILRKVAHVRFLFPKDKIDEESDYLVGNTFTMADVFLFPCVAFFVRYGLDIGKYPAMEAYYNKVKDRPSVKTTWPPHWANGQSDSSVLGSI